MKQFSWQNKNVFITGGTGLLGPWLIKDLLQKKANVFVLVRDIIPNSLFFMEGLDKQVNVVFGDLLDLQLLQRVLNEYDIDTVFHLGAQAIVVIANRSPISSTVNVAVLATPSAFSSFLATMEKTNVPAFSIVLLRDHRVPEPLIS